MDSLEALYNGGAIFVVGLALLIIYKIIDLKLGNGKSNGNGNNSGPSLPTTQLTALNESMKEVGRKIDKQTETLGEKLDLIVNFNTQHEVLTTDAVNATMCELKEIKEKVGKCETEINTMRTIQSFTGLNR